MFRASVLCACIACGGAHPAPRPVEVRDSGVDAMTKEQELARVYDKLADLAEQVCVGPTTECVEQLEHQRGCLFGCPYPSETLRLAEPSEQERERDRKISERFDHCARSVLADCHHRGC